MARRKFGLYGVSNKFRFTLQDVVNNVSYVLNFTTDYSALYTIDQGIATRHAFDDGSKAKELNYIDLEWVLVWDGFLNTDDGLMLPKIKNGEFDGWLIHLQPDIDVLKSYKVQIIEDKRRLEHYHNLTNTAKSYMLAFENVDPVTRYNQWVDHELPDYFTADEMDFV